MSTMSPDAETYKNTNSIDNSTNSVNKKTTMAIFSSTDYTSKITTLENKPTTKAVTDEEKATGLATKHCLSIIAISVFVPFFLIA